MGMREKLDISNLVQPQRVHRSVYTDPAIFALEMQRIFTRAWVYVAHDSQVPNPGDYITTLIGDQSVIMLRALDGAIHVLYNRCAHKGAKVLPSDSVGSGCGNTGKLLRCCYHGWTYRCDGSLHSIPLRAGYEDTGFDASNPDSSMRKLARVESYRGFVFACQSIDGPGLKTFLGGIASSIDNFCDRAPRGTVQVTGGVQRVIQRSNWKIFFENLHDTMHPMVVHESSGQAARKVHQAFAPGTPKPFEVVIVDGNIEPYAFWAKLELKGYDYGHGYMEAIFNPPKDPVSLAYLASLEQAYGKERAAQIVSVNRHNTIIYPSGSPHTSFQQFRVIRPLSVDHTLVEIFTFKLDGAPEAVLQRALKYTNIVNSPSSIVMADDLEAYNRVQEGLLVDGGEWVSLYRRAGQDVSVEGGLSSNGDSEMPMRNQFRAWAHWMGKADSDARRE